MNVGDRVMWVEAGDPDSMGLEGVIVEVGDDGMFNIVWDDGVDDWWYAGVFEAI